MPMTELLAARAASEELREHGWSVRQGAVCSGGSVDIAAERSWRRGTIEARVRLIIRCDDDGVLLTPCPAAPVSLPFYFFGDDDRQQRRAIGEVLARHEVDPAPIVAGIHRSAYRGERAVITPARVDPPPAPASASVFRGSLGQVFELTRAVRDDLLRHDLDGLADDLPTVLPLPPRCDLIHPIVLTPIVLTPPCWPICGVCIRICSA